MAATAAVTFNGLGITCLLLLLAMATCLATETWQSLPALETFATYEDMQRYFDQRNLRSLRHIDNPTDDSYLAAFNQYNEQLEASGQTQPQSHVRQKREQRQLPSAPRLLRFELADAVEPSMELKQLLREHQSRSIKTKSISSSTTTEQPLSSTTVPKRSRKPRRQRRSALNRQPANFKVSFIPFEATDAREPDAVTAQLIKRARALDLERLQSKGQAQRIVRKAEPLAEFEPAVGNYESTLPPQTQTRSALPDFQRPAQRPFKLRIRKTKRSKRSAPLQMFKFELADAKAPPAMLQRQARQMKPALLTLETQLPANKTQVQVQSTTPPPPQPEDNLVLGGSEATAETKRMYIYKEAPQSHAKSKKSLSALPHEVQKVITQLMKEGHGGKAYIKYLPTQKSDYEHFKTKPQSYSSYSLKPGSYIKYVPVKAVDPPVQVHIQPVPVVEQLRYVYKPIYTKQYSSAPLAQPIVVQDTTVASQAEEVHHTYSAELSAPPPPPPVAVDFSSQFRASKPDPLHEPAEPAPTSYFRSFYGNPHIKPIEHYKYEIHSNVEPQPSPQPSAQPLIKIEYHAPADSVKEHYKELPEFRELSTLIGKSPDDQIHGLTYLLAKEMQAKLQRQGKQLIERPQDSTAPILFHPSSQPQPQLPQPSLKALAEHGSLGVLPGRLIGMGKAKQYVPIVEPGNNDVKELPAPAAKLPTPSSFIDFAPGHGLSHGYEGVRDEQPLTTTHEHVIHHPTLTHHGLLGTTLPAKLEYEEAGSDLHQDKALQQYASKYAFGYRIRDFHTGNDFGHKQNRDLHGVTRGQYHILLPDGRIQNVIYHADDTGFHADVSFEGGTARH